MTEENKTEAEGPSLQEMFNRAWNGLKSQGWEPCAPRVS